MPMNLFYPVFRLLKIIFLTAYIKNKNYFFTISKYIFKSSDFVRALTNDTMNNKDLQKCKIHIVMNYLVLNYPL